MMMSKNRCRVLKVQKYCSSSTSRNSKFDSDENIGFFGIILRCSSQGRFTAILERGRDFQQNPDIADCNKIGLIYKI